jgi:spoIIIJ-associated protein
MLGKKEVVKSSRTIEEAVKLALIELGTSEDQVDVEVIEEPSKGLFGLIGTKDATVRVSIKDDPLEIAESFLQDLFREMKMNVRVEASLEGEQLSINLSGDKMAILIGRRGTTLDALQYLVSLAVNKDRKEYIRVFMDTENYREKREKTLMNLAKKLARKAKKTRKDIVLEPMNPYERRIIHSTLQGDPHVSTRSEGEEPYRKVVISLNKK